MKFTSGLPETACGKGSQMEVAANLIAKLPDLLRKLGVKRLVDAPCGDLNWMASVDLAGIDYIGVDISLEHLVKARRNKLQAQFNAASVCLIAVDILMTSIPRGDARLCRDFLQHLPMANVRTVLGNFLISGTPWLLATSHVVKTNADLTEIGGFRPLNLALLFDSKPVWSIKDPHGSNRILGAWPRDVIAKSLQ